MGIVTMDELPGKDLSAEEALFKHPGELVREPDIIDAIIRARDAYRDLALQTVDTIGTFEELNWQLSAQQELRERLSARFRGEDPGRPRNWRGL